MRPQDRGCPSEPEEWIPLGPGPGRPTSARVVRLHRESGRHRDPDRTPTLYGGGLPTSPGLS